MKVLAIEKEIKTIDWKNESRILTEEAKAVYQLMLSDSLREIYFNENSNAVLVLECQDKDAARLLLNSLPLVNLKMIEFDIMELHPYKGLSRLMDLG